ncbi:hypothetical protein [Bordetella phage vB_BbrM_PHB04]|uniref:Uncharacterized protein n=1 Tax=Bordetella phage vB_BbrM_PHB04 TaxID=2029657 RepID=A0A291LAN6_9CAUD|nr:hypothetical protein HOS14_gp059 [Bordetella phage vB_BbrM_PHB04]ATI15677.1 hypothetical protein [Bordetella phage vB_BbrM_PHB04]
MSAAAAPHPIAIAKALERAADYNPALFVPSPKDLARIAELRGVAALIRMAYAAGYAAGKT